MIRKDNKGQISAEYLLLMVVLLLIIGTVTLPLVGRSIDASNDVSWASDANIAVDSLTNAANVVYSNGPGSKRTINFYIPRDTTLNINGNTISMTFIFSDDSTPHTVTSNTNYKINTINNQVLNRGWYDATITWQRQSNININITST